MLGLVANDGPDLHHRVYALSIHRTMNAIDPVCAPSDWDVPVEVPLYRSLNDALATGRLQPVAEASEAGAVLVTAPDLPDDAAAMVARTPRGDCVLSPGLRALRFTAIWVRRSCQQPAGISRGLRSVTDEERSSR